MTLKEGAPGWEPPFITTLSARSGRLLRMLTGPLPFARVFARLPTSCPQRGAAPRLLAAQQNRINYLLIKHL